MDQRTRTRLQSYGKPGGAWFREGLVVLQWRDCAIEVLERASCEANDRCSARSPRRTLEPRGRLCGGGGPRDAPVVLLEQLARHAAEQVRRGVARNPSVPPALLGVLAEDRSPAVTEATLSSPACPPGVLERAARQRRLQTARNPSTPAAALVAACADDSLFRDYAAANPAMPAERLEELVDARETASRTLRHSLASNPALPAHLFQRLLVDATDDEVLVLLRNPALPDDVLLGYATGYHLSDEGNRDHAGDALYELRLRYARRRARTPLLSSLSSAP